jgi:hypothetical protein
VKAGVAAILGITALALGAAVPTAAQERSKEAQIAGAVLALPAGMRDGAEVRAPDGETVLREGRNDMICLADQPGDGRYGVSCYHRSLEPFMARGRELRAQGVEGMEYQQTRWREAEEGRLVMPSGPAMVYNLGFPTEDVDPATADWTEGGRLHAIYIPFATSGSTGLPTSPEGGGPWLMWPGEASAHVMISIPPSGGGDGGS